jgi:hypothetical protein
VRHGRDYYESNIYETLVDGQTVLEALLPPIEHHDYVDIGVCGKDIDSPESTPVYTSTSARYPCEKSVLCGTAVRKADPKLLAITATENGSYRAVDRGADGFYEVNVQVASKLAESRTVDLSMRSGNQVINPSGTNRTMDSVTVRKPISLIPENIKKNINIAGVVGTYEQRLVEKEIRTNGEYIPTVGIDGFSKVIVNVNERQIEKTIQLGESFTYDYDAFVDVVVLPPSIVSYDTNDGVVTFTGASLGSCKITVKDLDSVGNIVNTIYYIVSVVEADIVVSGTLDVTTNGIHDVAKYASVNVNVPVPDGYIDSAIVAQSVAGIDALLGGN